MMLRPLLERKPHRLWTWVLVAGILLSVAVLSRYFVYYQKYVLILIVASLCGAVLLLRPILGLPALVLAALLVPFELSTGTAVGLNKVTLLLPLILAAWLLDMMRRGRVQLASSQTNVPLVLFLVSGLLSLLIGRVFWDPAVPDEPGFLIVQLAQWAIFVFSAGAFWLSGNLVRDESWLQRITWIFLSLAGGLAVLCVLPYTGEFTEQVTTAALRRAPFWMLLTAVAGGQLLFNRTLTLGRRLFCSASVVASLFYAFFVDQESASTWIGVVSVLGVLAWLRFPRLRWLALVLIVVLTASGLLTGAVYKLAGGDAEWQQSGVSRLALIGRTVEVTLRNPITGLGPAAYRVYARTEPIYIQGAYYFVPWISSHNNYVDLFSHVGIVGLALLIWFSVALARLGLRLRAHFTEGFAAGYVNSMLAAGAGALVLMLLADWILPFVYNIGFPGFQASMLVWLFLGGLVALEQIADRERAG